MTAHIHSDRLAAMALRADRAAMALYEREAVMALNDEEEAALRREFDDTKVALKKANDEAKGHRLTADRLGKNADELRAKLEQAEVDGKTALDILREELTGKLIATEQATAERDKASRERITLADLRVAAKDAGMADLDALKLLDREKLKLADDGAVTNAADVLAEMKKAKPWAFGTATTSSTHAPPNPGGNQAPTQYRDMTKEQQAEWRKANGIR